MDYEARAKEVIAEVCGVDVAILKPETQLVADLGVDSARARPRREAPAKPPSRRR